MSWKRENRESDEDNFDEDELLGDDFEGDEGEYLVEEADDLLEDDDEESESQILAFDASYDHSAVLHTKNHPAQHDVKDLCCDEEDMLTTDCTAQHEPGTLDTQVNDEEYEEFSEHHETDKQNDKSQPANPDVHHTNSKGESQAATIFQHKVISNKLNRMPLKQARYSGKVRATGVVYHVAGQPPVRGNLSHFGQTALRPRFMRPQYRNEQGTMRPYLLSTPQLNQLNPYDSYNLQYYRPPPTRAQNMMQIPYLRPPDRFGHECDMMNANINSKQWVIRGPVQMGAVPRTNQQMTTTHMPQNRHSVPMHVSEQAVGAALFHENVHADSVCELTGSSEPKLFNKTAHVIPPTAATHKVITRSADTHKLEIEYNHGLKNPRKRKSTDNIVQYPRKAQLCDDGYAENPGTQSENSDFNNMIRTEGHQQVEGAIGGNLSSLAKVATAFVKPQPCSNVIEEEEAHPHVRYIQGVTPLVSTPPFNMTRNHSGDIRHKVAISRVRNRFVAPASQPQSISGISYHQQQRPPMAHYYATHHSTRYSPYQEMQTPANLYHHDIDPNVPAKYETQAATGYQLKPHSSEQCIRESQCLNPCGQDQQHPQYSYVQPAQTAQHVERTSHSVHSTSQNNSNNKLFKNSVNLSQPQSRMHPLDALHQAAEMAKQDKSEKCFEKLVKGQNVKTGHCIDGSSRNRTSQPFSSTDLAASSDKERVVKGSFNSTSQMVAVRTSTLNERFKKHHQSRAIQQKVEAPQSISQSKSQLQERKQLVQPGHTKPTLQVHRIRRTITQAESHAQPVQTKYIQTKAKVGTGRLCCKILNLDRSISMASVKEMGMRAGAVNKVGRLKKNPEIVVITFLEETHAIAFRRQNHNTEVNGRRIMIEFISSKSPANK